MARFLLLSLLLVSGNVFAQTDTTWFNKYWEKVSKDSAMYFRPPVKKLADGHYEVKDYYVSTGKLQMNASANDSEGLEKDGLVRSFYEDGQIESEVEYLKGGGNGSAKEYWAGSDKLSAVTNYKNGNYDGERVLYYRSGKPERIENWKKGKLRAGKCFTQSGLDTTYYPSKCCPDFPGGDEKYFDFIAQNVRYPKEYEYLKIKGTVKLELYFDKQGYLQHVTVAQKLHPVLDAEAVKGINRMPRIEPAFDTEGNNIEFVRGCYINFNYKYAR